jgi:hypothetical protein
MSAQRIARWRPWARAYVFEEMQDLIVRSGSMPILCWQGTGKFQCGHVQVHTPVGHTLFNTEALLVKNSGHAPRTMSAMQTLAKRMKVAEPIDAPTALPPVDDAAVRSVQQHLQGSAGEVPGLKELGKDLESLSTPFKVR